MSCFIINTRAKVDIVIVLIFILNSFDKTGERARQLRALVDFAEDPGCFNTVDPSHP